MSTVNIHLKLQLPRAPAALPPSSAGGNHKDRFIAAYGVLQSYLLQDASETMMLSGPRKEYVRKMMDATCLGGKYNRGITVIDVVDVLASSTGVTGEQKDALLFEACVCGWMIEMLQAHFLVEDDIMDSSITRRDKPCWYRWPGVTTQSAINDGLIVMAMASELAAHFLNAKPAALATILRAFHRVDYYTTMGQLYDVTSMRNGEDIDPEAPQKVTTDFKEFIMENFQRIVKYKTSYYTYHLPLVMGVALCQHLPGVAAIPADATEKIAMLMGEYFQAQDDFMDCFTDPIVLGKIGTDIEDMKCSWLAVNFLMAANATQRAAFAANYGKHDPAAVAVVKALYAEVDMKSKFEAYEEGIAAQVEVQLAALASSNVAFATACRNLWLKTYKRTK